MSAPRHVVVTGGTGYSACRPATRARPGGKTLSFFSAARARAAFRR